MLVIHLESHKKQIEQRTVDFVLRITRQFKYEVRLMSVIAASNPNGIVTVWQKTDCFYGVTISFSPVTFFDNEILPSIVYDEKICLSFKILNVT